MSAILLSDNDTTEPLSDCVEVTDVVQSVRNYITDILLWEAEEEHILEQFCLERNQVCQRDSFHLGQDKVSPIRQQRDFRTKVWTFDLDLGILLRKG